MKHFEKDKGQVACCRRCSQTRVSNSVPYYWVAILLVLTGVCMPPAHAQYENVWAFGNRAGLDFNTGIPTPIQTAMNVPNVELVAHGEAAASVCDRDGHLLFYSEGSFVWDRNHELMPNGVGLLPGFTGVSYTTSTSQGAIIVPVPGATDKYYLFSLLSMEHWGLGMGRLYYSMIDMSLNGGMGDVVPGEKGVFVDSMLLEKMTAIRGDRCNIWLITTSIVGAFASNFYAYEISASGLNATPVISEGGLGSFASSRGVLVPSPDGTRVLETKFSGSSESNSGAALFDFDPATGLLSNPMHLLPDYGAYGAAFSPDGSKVYMAQLMPNSIVQVDLNAGDLPAIVGSKVSLGTGISHLKLGPDGRIYFSSTHGVLGAIKFPDLAGAAAAYDGHFLETLPGTDPSLGFPNVVPVIAHDTVYAQQAVTAPCFGTGLSITAGADSNGWDFVWNTGSTGTSLEVSEPGTYWVSYRTPPCNFHTDTFAVSFPNGVLPTITVTDACTGIANGTAFATTYPGDPVSYYYTWLSGSDTLSQTDTLLQVPAGSYSLYVQTNTGCDTLLHFDIGEVDFELGFTPSDTLICRGDILEVQNTSDAHFTQFAWYFGDGDSSLLQQPPGHTYLQAGSYEVMLTGSGAICADTATASLWVDAPAAISFTMTPREICTGDHVSFALPAADSTLTGLSWSFGDGSEWQSGYEPRLQHAYDSAGMMTVRLQAQFRACADTSFTDTVRVCPAGSGPGSGYQPLFRWTRYCVGESGAGPC